MINVDPPDPPPPLPRFLPNQGWENCSLRSKRFRLVWEENKYWGFCATFLAVFDSPSSFFSPKRYRNACYAGYNFPILDLGESGGGGGVVPFYFVQDCRRIMGVLIRRREFNLGDFSYNFPLMELKFIFAENWTLTLVNYVKPSRPHQEKKWTLFLRGGEGNGRCSCAYFSNQYLTAFPTYGDDTYPFSF